MERILKQITTCTLQALRTLCKDNGYFASEEAERVQTMTDVELLCEALELTRLEELNKELTQAAQDKGQGREVLMKEVGGTASHGILVQHKISMPAMLIHSLVLLSHTNSSSV